MDSGGAVDREKVLEQNSIIVDIIKKDLNLMHFFKDRKLVYNGLKNQLCNYYFREEIQSKFNSDESPFDALEDFRQEIQEFNDHQSSIKTSNPINFLWKTTATLEEMEKDSQSTFYKNTKAIDCNCWYCVTSMYMLLYE